MAASEPAAAAGNVQPTAGLGDTSSTDTLQKMKTARLKIRTMKQELLYCVDLPAWDPRSAQIAIQDIKLELQSVLGIPPVAQFLVYKGQYLSNSKTLGDYSLPAAPRPVKLAYRRRRNKRGVQQQALKPTSSAQEDRDDSEDGSLGGALSLQTQLEASPGDDLAGLDGVISEGGSGSDSDSDSDSHSKSDSASIPIDETGAPVADDAASVSTDGAGHGDLFTAARDASWGSQSGDSSGTELPGGTASQRTAAVPQHRVPLLMRQAAAARRGSVKRGWVNQWHPEQACEEQGDSHRSSVLYFTASAMIAQQLAKHFTWKVQGSYTSAVVALVHSGRQRDTRTLFGR